MRRRSGTKGYRSYRGESPGKKILIVLLLFILLCAVAFLVAQRYVVYNHDGSYRFEFPWTDKAAEEKKETVGDPDAVEIIVEQPEKSEISDFHALELDTAVLAGGWEAALQGLAEDINAVAIRVKEPSGKLLYDTNISGAIECGAAAGSSVARAALTGINDSDFYTIARISALHDSLYAYAHMTDAAVCQLTGYVWFDTYSTHWLAPEKEAARQYVCDVAKECAALGFDELLLDSYCYPRDGRMSRIKTDERTMTKTEALTLLGNDLHAALKGTDTALSVAVDEDIVLAGSEERTGIVMSELAGRFDRIYVETTAEKLPELRAALGKESAKLVLILRESAKEGAYLIGK